LVIVQLDAQILFNVFIYLFIYNSLPAQETTYTNTGYAATIIL